MTWLVVLLVWFALSPVVALACGAFIRAGRGPQRTEASSAEAQPDGEQHSPPLAA